MFHVPSFIDDPCLHTFVMVGRITFSVDIFPLVIVLGEIYDLITAAMMWSRPYPKQPSRGKFMAGLQCHAIKNKKRNCSINQIKKLGCER